ncbi:MAG: exodeoxyribonuclease VII small subunit [Firmicutes bacterium]|nr:exodeoxyribonuclease VII small subunit [Bacillota bacterium]
MTDNHGLMDVEALSYEQAISELDQIINQLDTGQIDIDSLQNSFRRAVDIAEEIDRRIMRAKSEVEAILPRLSGLSGKAAPSGDAASESIVE